jgi:hypothetical protein
MLWQEITGLVRNGRFQIVGQIAEHDIQMLKKLFDMFATGNEPLKASISAKHTGRDKFLAAKVWGQLLFNILPFPEDKFSTLRDALNRADSSIDIMRKETLTLFCMASEIAIINAPNYEPAEVEEIKRDFLSECFGFIQKNDPKWGTLGDFQVRLNLYRETLSSYFSAPLSPGETRNILEPIGQVYWRSLIGLEPIGTLREADAQLIKSTYDQTLESFLPLMQLALREMQLSKER